MTRNQGRRKHQATKQFSLEPNDLGANLHLCLFGEHANSELYHLARECITARPLLKSLESICAEVPEIAQATRDQVEAAITRLGRFIIESDPDRLLEFVKIYTALVEQSGRVADPVRLLLMTVHERFYQERLRLPTVAETLAGAVEMNPLLKDMDDSQFRRTCKGIGLTFTPQKRWDRICGLHRKLSRITKHNPTRSEFFDAAREAGLCPDGLSRDDFSAACIANGLKLTGASKSRLAAPRGVKLQPVT